MPRTTTTTTATRKATTGKGKGKGKGKATKPALATFAPVEKVAPADRRGTSTCKYPVPTTSVACLNATIGNGNVLLGRSKYHVAAMAQGVCYNTARTQVQRYLQWVHAGSNPADLPKGVTLPPNYVAPSNI